MFIIRPKYSFELSPYTKTVHEETAFYLDGTTSSIVVVYQPKLDGEGESHELITGTGLNPEKGTSVRIKYSFMSQKALNDYMSSSNLSLQDISGYLKLLPATNQKQPKLALTITETYPGVKPSEANILLGPLYTIHCSSNVNKVTESLKLTDLLC